jgi:hypothetical protein
MTKRARGAGALSRLTPLLIFRAVDAALASPAGLDPGQLAAELGCSRNTIRNYLTDLLGIRQPIAGDPPRRYRYASGKARLFTARADQLLAGPTVQTG